MVRGEARIRLGSEEIVVKENEACLVRGSLFHSVWNNRPDGAVRIGLTTRMRKDG